MADFAGEEKKEEKPVVEEQGDEEEDVNPEVFCCKYHFLHS